MLTLTGLPVATLADLFVLKAPVSWVHVEGLAAAIVGAALVITSARGQPAEEPT
jgi:drug/metabolite transporter (DMT)-like permease